MQVLLSLRSLARPRRAAAFLALALVAVVAAGCADDTAATTAATAATTEAPAAAPVVAYFPTVDGEHIRAVTVPAAGSSSSVLDATLRALADGPTGGDLAPALPEGTRLLSVSSEGGVARVDLSSEFAAAYPSGGSAAEIAALAPIVFSATEVAGVDSVAITVEGATPDVPSQFDLGTPLGRADFPSEIVVTAP
jgi:spore germination protein GerM